MLGATEQVRRDVTSEQKETTRTRNDAVHSTSRVLIRRLSPQITALPVSSIRQTITNSDRKPFFSTWDRSFTKIVNTEAKGYGSNK